MFKRALTIAFVALGLMVAPASAATINFLDSAFNPGSTQSKIYDLGYLGTSWVGTFLTVSSIPTNLYWDSTDGFGVTGGENDEVDGSEVLTFTFSKEVTLNSIGITDLFHESTSHPYVESGKYSIDGGTTTLFYAAPGQIPGTNGVTSVNLGGVVGTTVAFFSNDIFEGENHDFSVSSISISQAGTPEPGTMLLFGTALASGAFFRRRRRKDA